MRACLVVNPHATSTDTAVQAAVVERLAAVVDLSVVETQNRNDGMRIAREAVGNKVDVVIGLGGDGTINELANGLLSIDSSDRPALAALPGGNANVFARALGFPRNTIQATEKLCVALEANTSSLIGVGSVEWRANESDETQSRWFLFNAGLGIDARVISAMDSLRQTGKRVSDMTYAGLALRELLSHSHTSMHAYDHSGIDLGELEWALVANLSPWTYVGERALNPTPGVGPHTGLDLFGARSLRLREVPGVLRALVNPRPSTQSGNLVHLEDQPGFTADSISAVALQVDGEPLGLATWTRFTHHPELLKVVW